MGILKFTLHKSADEDYYFRLRNIGDEIMLTSRNYSSFRNCINEIRCLKEYRDFKLEEEPQFAACQHRFALRSSNGRAIAMSQNYISRTRMSQDVKVVTEAMREADIEDCSTTVRFFRKVNTKI